MPMGRRRAKDLDLPPRMRRVGAAFYYDAGGKPRKWIPLGSDKAGALLRWAELRGADASGRTVGDLIDKYLAQCDVADTTMINYRKFAAVIRKYFGDAPVSQVRAGHIQEFHDQHPKRMLARNLVVFFKQILKKAVQWEWIPTSPADKVEVRPQSKRKRYLTDDEFLAIRAHLAEPFQVAVDLAYLLGLRVSDVVRLTFSDVKDGKLSITQKKTGEPLIYEVTPELEDVLARGRALKRPIRGFHVICNRRGKPYTEKAVSTAFKAAADALGIKDVRFHDLRAKSASDEQETAQKRLGHRSAAATLSYLRKPVVVSPIRRKL
jgi:integrase